MWSMDTNCNPISMPNMAAMKTEPFVPNANTDNAMGMPQKEVCRGCHRQIEDRFLLRVMDNSWHEQCLQCSICQEALTRSCFVKDGKLFCKHDYDKLYGVRCCGCLQTIPSTEFVMRALGNVYHVRCFVCVACGHQLQKGDQFVLKDGRIFCRLDFEKEFAMMQMSPKNDWCPTFSPKSDEDSSVDENDMEAPKGPKRPRTILTTSQRRKFKASFEINPKPCRKVRETLASETGLSVRVVQVWFQNQRAKMKKLARRQSDGQSGGDSKKNGSGNNQKQTTKRKKDDDGSDTSTTPSDSSNIAALPSNSETRPHYDNQLTPFNNNSQEIYGSNNVGENLYNNNLSMDGSLENIEDVLINQGNQQNNGSNGPVVNPIDKLYSMQSSYFSTD